MRPFLGRSRRGCKKDGDDAGDRATETQRFLGGRHMELAAEQREEPENIWEEIERW